MQVRAIRTCFVGSYRVAGEEFEYDGPPNSNLQPLDGAWASKQPKRAASGTLPAAAPQKPPEP